jgi:hypothetical protein
MLFPYYSLDNLNSTTPKKDLESISNGSSFPRFALSLVYILFLFGSHFLSDRSVGLE